MVYSNLVQQPQAGLPRQAEHRSLLALQPLCQKHDPHVCCSLPLLAQAVSKPRVSHRFPPVRWVFSASSLKFPPLTSHKGHPGSSGLFHFCLGSPDMLPTKLRPLLGQAHAGTSIRSIPSSSLQHWPRSYPPALARSPSFDCGAQFPSCHHHPQTGAPG